MTDSADPEISETILDIIIPGIAEYHIEIERIYRHVDPDSVPTPEGGEKLLQFNGYYALDCAPGAFFAIDANLHVKNGSSRAITDISFLVSLDGKTSGRFPFTGTFDGITLQQSDAAEASFSADLQLVHSGPGQSGTATLSGTIGLPGGAMTAVTGVTYNNLIPYSVFEGIFYPASFAGGAGQPHGGAPLPVARIDPGYQLSYDYGSGDGVLKPVPTYTYNLNMYYFSFGPKAEAMSLIMGTAAGQGLACNNMYVDPKTKTLMSRSLTTIPDAPKPTNPSNNSRAEQLAAFSGYYQLPGIADGAFLALQGEYTVLAGSITGYTVQISVSPDGRSSQTVNFDDTMQFEDGRLTVPGLVDAVFTRAYDPATGSLASLVGTVLSQQVTGHSYFNPVPLSTFGGVPLTNAGGDTLTIESDTMVTYNGNALATGIYVPTMYILAGATSAGAFMMSFGTSGLKGNACIIMPASGAGPGARFVYAIPDGGN